MVTASYPVKLSTSMLASRRLHDPYDRQYPAVAQALLPLQLFVSRFLLPMDSPFRNGYVYHWYEVWSVFAAHAPLATFLLPVEPLFNEAADA